MRLVSRKHKTVLQIQVALLGLLFLCIGVAHAVTYSNAPTTFSWIDPSTHTPVAWSNPTQGTGGTCDTIGDDSITAPINIGFTFNFGGVNYTQVQIMSNGRLQFNNSFCNYGTQTVGPPRGYSYPYPDTNLVGTMKVYGADIDTSPNGSGGGPGPTTCPPATCSVRYTVTPLGTAPNRQFVVTWTNTPDWGSTGSFYNFQVILNEDGSFIYQYGASNNPDLGQADIGWEVDTTDWNLYTYTNIGTLANTAVRFFIPNTVAEYRMEQASWSGANSVVDSSGNNNNGSPVGGAQTVPGGYICRGANIPYNTSSATIDAIDTGLNPATRIGSSGTITFWYKSNIAWNVANQQLLDATLVKGQWFFLVKRSNGRLRFVVADNAGNTTVAQTGSNSFGAGTWVHIGITWDLTGSGSNNLSIYVNGVLASSQNIGNTYPLSNNLDTLYLGDNRSAVIGSAGTGYSADGVLDEVRIYNFEGGLGLIQRDYNYTRSCAPPINNFLINVGAAAASTCSPKNITITARDANNNVVTNYTGTIQLTTSTGHGNWSKVTAGGTLTPGAADSGAATYTFVAGDNGVITLALSNAHADDATVTVVDNAVPATSSTSSIINFRDNTFVITNDPIQVVGRNQAMTAALWQKDPTTGNCAIATGYSGAKSLDAWLTRDAMDPGGAAPTIGAVSLPNSPPSNNLTLTFTGGQAAFNLSTTDVGKYSLNLRDHTRMFATGVDISGVSNVITTRPWLYVAVSGNPGVNTPAGAVFTSAGTPFTTTVSGVLWQAGQDSITPGVPNPGVSLAGNPVAPSYAWATTLSPTTPFTPATPADSPAGTGVAGSLDRVSGGSTIAQASFSSGSATTTDWRYSEVGSFTIQAAATNYLNSGVNLATTNGVVGRFTPAYLDVTAVIPGCIAGAFTYAGLMPVGLQPSIPGQPFSVTVMARNAEGVTTQNYDGKRGFAKDTTLSDAGATANFTNNFLTAAGYTNGVGSDATITYRFAAKETPPQTLTLRTVDMDNVSSAGPPPHELTTVMRSGRVHIINAYGSELADLPLPMRAEYYAGPSTGWITNPNDGCTTVLLSNLTPSNPITVGSKTTNASIANAPFVAGDAGLQLSAPGVGGTGYVDVRADLTTKAWLQYDWSGTGSAGNPTGRATFGLYRGSQRNIYQRERY